MDNNSIRAFRILFIVFFVVLVSASCSGPDTHEHTVNRVLVVHSYHKGLPWTDALHHGVMDILTGREIKVKVMFMDTKQHTDEAFKQAAGIKVLNMVNKFKPHVVIASDDNAQAYAGKFLINRSDVSVVFCGVNQTPETYGYSSNNVTGILERPLIRSTLNLLEKVLPAIDSYTFISDNSPTSSGVISYIKQLKLTIKSGRFVQTNDYTRWQEEWQKINSDIVIVFAFHVLRQNGQPVAPDDALRWMVAHMTKPVVSFFANDIEAGFLLGHVHSGYEHGELAAKKALEILKGKKANEIPITTARGGLIVINAKTAGQFDIDISPIINIADQIYGAAQKTGSPDDQ